MKVRIKKFRAVAQSSFLAFYPGGACSFTKLGQIEDVPDEHGYALIAKYPDMLEVVQLGSSAGEDKRPEEAVKRKGRPPREEKMVSSYENKAEVIL